MQFKIIYAYRGQTMFSYIYAENALRANALLRAKYPGVTIFDTLPISGTREGEL